MSFDINDIKNKMMGNGISGNSTDKQENRNKSKSNYGNYNGRNRNDNRNNHQNNNRSFSGNRQNGNEPQGYVGAPYNFVEFSDSVYEYQKEQLIDHDTIREGCFSGEIAYEITAQTPIIVSRGVQKAGEPEQFCRNAYGEYAIPGSTMRGLIRNNVQILGLCSMGDDVEDYALMYRNVAKGKEKKRYGELLGAGTATVGKKQFSVLKNVKAGYLKEENGKYVIYPTCLDSISDNYGKMNYYILSERTIIENYLESQRSNNISFAYPFFKQKGVLKHKLDVKDGETGFDKYKKKDIGFFRTTDKNGRIHYKREKNKEYQPYFKEACYAVKGERTVSAVKNSTDSATGMKKGYVMSSGFMNEKKAVYIIPEIDTSKEPISVKEKDVTAFQIDYKKRENVLGESKDFFALPKKGEMKPVFYISLGGKLYFGFTPRLRVFYDHTIKEGLSEAHNRADGLDYAKAMFGYIGENDSYKSRVSFSDAVVVGDSVKEDKSVSLVLGGPKATSYSDYLAPKDGQAVTYNDKDFRLRGVKQYWLKDEVISDSNNQGTNDKVKSSMKPLPKGTKFQGKVRFKNLTADELGLLLWSLKLDEDSLMNIGKAKAFGYGSIALELLSAKKLNAEAAYNSDALCLNPWEELNVEALIKKYQSKISEYLNGKIEELPHIKQFFAMKDKKRIPDAEATRFMTLEEYGKRNDKVLPSIASIVKAQKK